MSQYRGEEGVGGCHVLGNGLRLAIPKTFESRTADGFPHVMVSGYKYQIRVQGDGRSTFSVDGFRQDSFLSPRLGSQVFLLDQLELPPGLPV